MEMEDNIPDSFKTICCICLSVDRKLVELCKIDDGLNILFLLLSYDTEAHEAVFRIPVERLSTCWECEAQLKNMCEFRKKAAKAQKILDSISDDLENGIVNIKLNANLSKLLCSHQNTYNFTYNYETDIANNFVSCGSEIIKSEILSTPPDFEVIDVPFFEMKNGGNQIENTENTYTYENDAEDSFVDCGSEMIEIEILNKPADLEVNEKPPLEIDKQEIKNHNTDNKYYSKVELSVEEMYERLKLRKNEKSLVTPVQKLKCETCVLYFKTDNELNEHKFAVHTQLNRIDLFHNPSASQSLTYDSKKVIKKRTNFKCSQCDECFNSRTSRYTHLLKCHREGFKCEICERTFTFKHILLRHIKTHDPQRPLAECTICKKMITPENLTTHHRIHTDIQYFCFTCNKYYKSSYTYKYHLVNSKKHAGNNMWKYECKTCSERFLTQTALLDHTKYFHEKKPQYECRLGAKLITTDLLLNPTSSQPLMYEKEKANFKCSQCDECFETQSARHTHLLREHREGFKCDICGKTCTYKKTLIVHIMTHHPHLISLVECTICKRMVHPDNLKRHEMKHTEKTRHFCLTCNKYYKCEYYYKLHLKKSKMHSGRDMLQYGCTVCSERFLSKRALHHHIKGVHKSKPQYKCTLCKKSMTTQNGLTRHIKSVHQGIKEPVKKKECQYCGENVSESHKSQGA